MLEIFAKMRETLALNNAEINHSENKLKENL